MLINAEVDVDLSTDEDWGIVNLNPIFAIGDTENFVASGSSDEGTNNTLEIVK